MAATEEDFQYQTDFNNYLESPAHAQEARRKRAKEARKKQVKAYNFWVAQEAVDGRDVVRPRKITFHAEDRLRDATTRSDHDEVRRILQSESKWISDLNATSEATGVSLLHLCCVNEDIQGVRQMLELGASPNIQDNDLWTPLHVAAACSSKEIVELLLSYGADSTKLDVDGNFPGDNTDNKEVLQLLFKNMKLKGIYEQDLASIRSCPAKALLAAISECIDEGSDLNVLNKNGVTFLHIAAANGYYQIAKLLLDAGADINVANDLGHTPLHVGSKFNQVKIVKLLLKRKANPLLLSDYLELAIDLAENEEILKYIQFVGGGKKLKKIPSAYLTHPNLSPVISSDLFGPPSPDMNRKPFTPSRARLYSIDMGAFQRAQIRSKPKDMKTKQTISKLEEIYENTTLVVKDSLDDGADVSVQGPALRKLHGSILQRRMSIKLELPDPCKTDNLATLPDLTQSIVLDFLMERYHKEQIYTCIGEILIALNPFKPLSFYTELVSHEYSSKPPNPSLPPHIFGVANRVFCDVMADQKSQCCVISGESGAGKTETCKLLVQQILFLTKSELELNIKIEQVNPILETFGNSHTVMNDNSSRFGKYLELILSPEGVLLGATFKDYLLEKLRVVVQAKNERNFHVFYMMYAGLSTEEKNKLGLVDPASHRCLTGSGASLEGTMTKLMGGQFQEVRDSLKAIGFSEQDESDIIQALAAVLHICDITFEPKDEGCEITNPSKVSVVSDLLQVNKEELFSCFTTDTIFTRGEEIVKSRTLVQANDNRDALAKAVYGRMFSWLVNGINHHLQPEDTGLMQDLRIGLLDIFGFEKFEKNSFEQMCINIANEQLQLFFNQHIFQWELEECAKEGITMEAVSYVSNKPIIDTFLERNVGLLAILNEESRFPRATDHTLALKLHKTLGSRENGIYVTPPNKGTRFSLSHYAGHVEYDVMGFLDKNRDALSASVSSLMHVSKSLLIRELFGTRLTRTGSVAASLRQTRSRQEESPFSHFSMKISRRLSNRMKNNKPHRKTNTARRAPPTVANHFRNSLNELMDKMNASHPHFIRCIKPNSFKKPLNYDREHVQKQLKYTGVMETTRIRRCGYPTRLDFEDFLTRFSVLREFYAHRRNAVSAQEGCHLILKSAGVEGWVSGKTKIMLKFNHTAQLDAHSSKINLKIIAIQRCYRDWWFRKCIEELVKERQEKAGAIKTFLTLATQINLSCCDRLIELNKKDSERFVTLVTKQTEAVKNFLSSVSCQCETCFDKLVELNKEDSNRHTKKQKEKAEKEKEDMFSRTKRGARAGENIQQNQLRGQEGWREEDQYYVNHKDIWNMKKNDRENQQLGNSKSPEGYVLTTSSPAGDHHHHHPSSLDNDDVYDNIDAPPPHSQPGDGHSQPGDGHSQPGDGHSRLLKIRSLISTDADEDIIMTESGKEALDRECTIIKEDRAEEIYENTNQTEEIYENANLMDGLYGDADQVEEIYEDTNQNKESSPISSSLVGDFENTYVNLSSIRIPPVTTTEARLYSKNGGNVSHPSPPPQNMNDAIYEDAENVFHPVLPQDPVAVLNIHSRNTSHQTNDNGSHVFSTTSIPHSSSRYNRIQLIQSTGNSPLDSEDYESISDDGSPTPPNMTSSSTPPVPVRVPANKLSSAVLDNNSMQTSATKLSSASSSSGVPYHQCRLSSSGSDVFAPENPPPLKESSPQRMRNQKTKSPSSVPPLDSPIPPSHQSNMPIDQNVRGRGLHPSSSVGGKGSSQEKRCLNKRVSVPIRLNPSVPVQHTPLPSEYYDYINSNELEPIVVDDMVIHGSRLSVPCSSNASPYTPPLKRKTHAHLSGAKSVGLEATKEFKKSSVDTISNRPPALLPSTLSKNRPPAPMPSDVLIPRPKYHHSSPSPPSSKMSSPPPLPTRNTPPPPSTTPLPPKNTPPTPSTGSAPPTRITPPTPSTGSTPPPPSTGSAPPPPPVASTPVGGHLKHTPPPSARRLAPAPNNESLSAGISSVQLKKSSERPVAQNSPSVPEGSVQDNLFSEMQNFKLRTKPTKKISVDSSVTMGVPLSSAFHVKLRPTYSAPGNNPNNSNSPPLPRTVVAPMVPHKPTVHKVTDGGLSSVQQNTKESLPEWKKALQKRKRSNQATVRQNPVEKPDQSSQIPAWKLELMAMRQNK